MVGWNHVNAKWKEKKCAVCSTVFIPKSGVHKFCSDECRGKWKYITGTGSTKNQYKDISGNWPRYMSRLQHVAGRKRERLTTEVLLEILEKQNYKCALSGIPLTCNLEVGKTFPTNVSVDRIEAGKEYTKENVQLVCRALNHWRSDTPIEEFVAFCRAVASYHDQLEIGVKDGRI